MISENQRLFRAQLFSRIVPRFANIGLWGPRVKKAYEDMGVMHSPTSTSRPSWRPTRNWAKELDAKKARWPPQPS